MNFDTKVPLELKEIQQWFASIITRPIDTDNQMMPISPSGIAMTEEAKKYITASPFLQASERIQLYNQQYWWRLLTIMHENFPLVTRLFGYYDFNQTIAFPYLVDYPPSHWSLNRLGSNLLEWVEKSYHEEDKELIMNSVELDFAYNCSFFAKKYDVLEIDQNDLEEFSKKELTLQPHVQLLSFDYNLFAFRVKMLEETPEYWIENEFPSLDKGKFYFILYRNLHDYVVSDTISAVAYEILKRFKAGLSIDDLSEWLETQDEKVSEEAFSNMQNWFCNWTALKILKLK